MLLRVPAVANRVSIFSTAGVENFDSATSDGYQSGLLSITILSALLLRIPRPCLQLP